MQSYLVSAECRVCYLHSIIIKLNWMFAWHLPLCTWPYSNGRRQMEEKKMIWKLAEEQWLTNWLDLDDSVCPHLALLCKLLEFFSVKVCFYGNMKFGIGSNYFPKADVNAYKPFVLSTWRDAALTVHRPETSYLHSSSHKSWWMQSYCNCEHRALHHPKAVGPLGLRMHALSPHLASVAFSTVYPKSAGGPKSHFFVTFPSRLC